MIVYKIQITLRADNDEQRIYKYISEKFGEVYAEKFRNKLVGLFKLLSRYPFIGRVAKNDPSLRVIIFNKQNKIVYKVKNEEIVILRLLNTKMNLSSRY